MLKLPDAPHVVIKTTAQHISGRNWEQPFNAAPHCIKVSWEAAANSYLNLLSFVRICADTGVRILPVQLAILRHPFLGLIGNDHE